MPALAGLPILLPVLKRAQDGAPLGVAGFGDLGAITVRAIDPDVERMLRPYRIAVVA